jgi:hypothetical protein
MTAINSVTDLALHGDVAVITVDSPPRHRGRSNFRADGREEGTLRFTADEIVERLTLPMINEGAKILDEDVAIRASDIDIIWINGYNWPAYRGGPMWWADHLGLAHVLDRLRALEADRGPQWAPSPLLERLAADGGRFQTWRR